MGFKFFGVFVVVGGFFVLAKPAGVNADVFRDVTSAEAIAVSTTAVGPSTSTFASRSQFSGRGGSDLAFCSVELAPIRYRYDGTNPTASVGHLVTSSSTFTIEGYQSIRNLRIIRQTGVNASVFCTYSRREEHR